MNSSGRFFSASRRKFRDCVHLGGQRPAIRLPFSSKGGMAKHLDAFGF
jgi:hypothetical protein